MNPKHPKTIRIGLHFGPKDVDAVVEFSTQEAADDWRRELQGPLLGKFLTHFGLVVA